MQRLRIALSSVNVNCDVKEHLISGQDNRSGNDGSDLLEEQVLQIKKYN